MTGRHVLGATDDHHEQLIGADQRHRLPRTHNSTERAIYQAVRYVCGQCGSDLRPSSQRAGEGSGAFRRAESSVTIELD